MTQPIHDRFTQRVTTTHPHQCWTWTGGIRHGIPSLYTGGKRHTPAARWAYTQWIGPIPDGLEVARNCENNLCVNPWHRQLRKPGPRGDRWNYYIEEIDFLLAMSESPEQIARQLGIGVASIDMALRRRGDRPDLIAVFDEARRLERIHKRENQCR